MGLFKISGMAQSPRFFGIMTVICYCIISASAQDCKSIGWFGKGCKYKCHCDPFYLCGTDGSCSKCQEGWFGPACQYVDLFKTGVVTPALAKTNDGMCESFKDSITIGWESSIFVTWLRLKFKKVLQEIPDKNGIQIRLKETNYFDGTGKTIMECDKQISALVDNQTVDIYCDMNLAVSQVIISGSNLTQLCTVQISGGRNIALKQSTSQSTTHSSYNSDLAVDGNVNNEFYGGSCTHTSSSDDEPSWTVEFPSNKTIYRYILHNREDLLERLRGFTIEAYNASGKEVFKFTDRQDCAAKTIYNITSKSIKSKIKKVKILGPQNGDRILTLCEVEIYGDQACPTGYYGRECEHKCNCAVEGEECFVSTGNCPSGCAPGFHQEGCQQSCNHGKWGISCLKKCDYRCYEDECDKVDGRCVNGCEAGFQGDRCDEACKAGTFGINCESVCPLNCNDKPCDIGYGKCYGCKKGYTGNRCDQECPAGWYGHNCSEPCGLTCAGKRLCHPVNGTCLDGCLDGYKGETCSEPCDPGKFGKDCVVNCSNLCFNTLCYHWDGTCINCPLGKMGDQCDRVCDAGRHGYNCNEKCSLNCYNSSACDPVDGVCLDGCLDGYKGDKCSEICESGKYGKGCQLNCSHLCLNQTCNHRNGTCTSCPPGNIGDQCHMECEPGKFGKDCVHNCNDQCFNTLCNHRDGTCINCPLGKMGDQCERVCDAGRHGYNCNETCSLNCYNSSACNPVDGVCRDGCLDGYKGGKCSEICESGKYGKGCQLNCSHLCLNHTCNYRNGTCISCPPGKIGDQCHMECEPGKFGKGCVNNCNDQCLNTLCNHRDGTCINCPLGKMGDQCERVCDAGRHGYNCNETCSLNCFNSSACNPIDGFCLDGCLDGYKGDKCSEICESGKYGKGCQLNCSHLCLNQACDHRNGTCTSCPPGNIGDQCDMEVRNTTRASE